MSDIVPATTKNITLLTPDNNQTLTGINLQQTTAEALKVAKHDFTKIIDANIRKHTADKKRADEELRSAREAYEVVRLTLPIPGDFARDLKGVVTAIAKFQPTATMSKEVLDVLDKEAEVDPAKANNLISVDTMSRRYSVCGHVLVDGRSVYVSNRVYALPKSVIAALDAIQEAEKRIADVLAELEKCKQAKLKLPHRVDEAEAAIARSTLGNSEVGRKVLESFGDLVASWSDEEGLDDTLATTTRRTARQIKG